MIYFLDENFGPRYAGLLAGTYGDDVRSAFTENTSGKADRDWISFIKEESIRNKEQWTIVTRDDMRENRQIIFANTPPLKFALLSSKAWNNATSAELEEALVRYWRRLTRYAGRTKTRVFTIDFTTGKATSLSPPRTA